MKPITKIILDTRRAKNNTENYPVKLRVTLVKQQKHYPLGIDMTKEKFYFVQNPGAIQKSADITYKRQLKEWKLKCDAILIKANKACDELIDFTFRAFETKWLSNKRSGLDVYACFEETITRMKANSRIGTANNYHCSLRSLQLFHSKLSFRDVDIEFLNEYERWILGNGKSISTVGIYLRPLRAIINEAISQGIISRETHYAFGKGKYQIPAARNIKKALTLDEISRIFHFEGIPGTWWQKGRDFFIFSYLCNGINMKDIASLKYKNIDGEYINFIRSKTKHTNRSSSTPISIAITTEVQSIINRWKSCKPGPEDFLFPILEINVTPEQEMGLVKQFTKMVNVYIKQIAGKVGITKHVTTYYARHTFATVLKRSGASTEFIGESLGHTSAKTTASYLDSFQNETKKEWAKVLINF